MAEQGRLVSTGSVIVDLVLTVDRVPDPGGDTVASSSLLTAGGGYNTLLAATRDGTGVVYAGQYGTGPFGELVRRALAELDVEVVQAGLADHDSGYCVALVDASSERTFVTTVGAEGALTRADLDLVPVRGADTVYVTGYSLAHPERHGLLPGWVADLPPAVRVVSDPSPLVAELDPRSLARLLARTDLLSANAREARLMTGLATPAEAALALVRRVREHGHVVVRDGADGCWLAGPEVADRARHVPGFAVRAVDSTGAGDTHVAVLAGALNRGLDLRAAARRANAAAALSVTRSGPATAPGTAEIDALLAGPG
ncbi:carbohydrate kinase family protein [Microlunatus lacustris]